MTVRSRSSGHYWGVVIEASDARAQADFYVRLPGRRIDRDHDGAFGTVAPPSGVAYVAVQRSPEHVPRVAGATEVGATLAGFLPQDDVRVMLDPAGHPFCRYVSQ